MNQVLTLDRNQRIKLKTLARRYAVELIVVFGARARGDARRDSDLDIGVLFARARAASTRRARNAFAQSFQG
ncbi:MAG: nucleotidyltransferase domain-containing protein [Chloroflexi bacterium]|nr:nucleotidyltransferase domain-containing protein [Chloroflexota bacterium]